MKFEIKNQKRTNGITLIALVITIIVMLILVTVTIQKMRLGRFAANLICIGMKQYSILLNRSAVQHQSYLCICNG